MFYGTTFTPFFAKTVPRVVSTTFSATASNMADRPNRFAVSYTRSALGQD